MLLRSRLVTFSRILLIGFAGLIIIGAGVTVYFDKIINRYEDSQAVESAIGRLYQFKSAWSLIDNRLITGIGPGVSILFSRWNPDRKHIQKALAGKAMPNAIHCAQLQVLVESGIPGLVLFMVITGAILWSVFRSKTGVDKNDMILLLHIGSVGAAVSVLVHISFGTELNNQQIFILFWALLGLARNMASENEPDGDDNLPFQPQQNMNWRSHEEK
jgi:O-antigen ligase